MQIKISGETPFRAVKNQFMVSPSASGYTLAYSADKENWTAYPQSVPANENLQVNGAMQYGWYMLSGNTSEDVIVII